MSTPGWAGLAVDLGDHLMARETVCTGTSGDQHWSLAIREAGCAGAICTHTSGIPIQEGNSQGESVFILFLGGKFHFCCQSVPLENSFSQHQHVGRPGSCSVDELKWGKKVTFLSFLHPPTMIPSC